MALPRISFGIIVFNGEPFTRYCLRALYPFAYEIIVVEGAVPGAENNASAEGHSTDGTLETLQRFKAEEDPEGKVVIVTRAGFWEEKDEMSQAYASRATGDYLWQVDIDEFYQPTDMQQVLDLLRANPEITAVSFKMLTFWGAMNYVADGWILRRGAAIYHRLFKWAPGYRYVTHRPPTVVDEQGHDLRNIRWIGGQQLARRGILMYHYSLLFPRQVREKSAYYERSASKGYSGGPQWAETCYMRLSNPFRVHNVYVYPSWLERFDGTHPPQIQAMWNDIAAGVLTEELRSTDDVERLLNSSFYAFRRLFVRRFDYVDRAARWPIRLLRRARQRIQTRRRTIFQ
jgi:glycosyltransferase involved in cell wall biosynthesis